MKRIFKFLPVALAAVALASCSSDDLTVTNAAGEIENVDGKLLVQVDGANEDVTRSGFITTINPASSMLRSSLFFSQGDKLKLYHEATSWKPEVWEAQNYGQYTNADGAAGGEVAVFDNTDATITEAEKAYGIFPATIGQFGNENRTSLKYDLSALKFIEYKAEAKDYNDGKVTVAAADDATGNTKAYTAPFPLWGVKNAGAKVMTVKHLTGILRLDLANVANSTMEANQARYIVIKSANKLTGELTTAGDVFNPNDEEKIDPDKLMTTAPKLVTKAATEQTELTAVPTVATAIAKEDIIVVKLTKDDPDHVMLFLPITAGNGETSSTPDIKVYVSKPVAVSATEINLSSTTNDLAFKADGTTDAIYELTADLIEAENKAQMKGFNDLSATEKQKVQPGVFYRINDDTSNQIDNAWTPFELAREIIKKDKAAYRDFDVYVTHEIKVKNEDSAPQNFYLDLSGSVDNYGMNAELQNYELKHNVTVHVTLEDASTDPANNKSILYVKTKGGKKLTLDITNATAAVDSIVVKANDLKSELELQNTAPAQQLPAIHVYEGNDDKVTLKSSTSKLVVNSNVKVDNATTTAINDVVLAKGTTKLSLLAGEVTKISIADAATTGDPYEPIAADVTIYTEGNAAIAEVDYTNMPNTTTTGSKKDDTYDLVYTSKYIKGSTVSSATTTEITGETGKKYITSAAQLAALSNDDVTVLGTYDLDGSATNDWTGLTLTMKQIQGAQFYRYSNAAARAIEGNTTIKNLYSATGLISTWTPSDAGSISNITFDGGNKVIGAADAGELGLLAGSVTTTAAATIKNIVVKGTNEVTGSGTNGTAMQGYGAVIGKTTGTSALQIANVNVEAGTKVKGYQYVGGIVGEVAGKIVFGMQSANGATDKFTSSAAYAATDVPNSSAATLETFMLGSAPYSIALPSTGSFFGGASACANNGDIMILGELTALTTARTGEKWGYYVANGAEYFPWTIHLNYNEIGHCGTEVSGTAVIASTSFKEIHMQTKTTGDNPTYGTTTKLVPYVGTQAQYDAAKAANTYGIGKTMYFDFVKKP